MKIHNLVVGPIETNCYIVEDESTKNALIIDPGEEPQKILDLIKKENLNVTAIVSTHGHFDHINGIPKLKSLLIVPFMIHEDDSYLLSSYASDIMKSLGVSAVSVKPDKLLKDGDEIIVGSTSFLVLHTPGHTQGSICLHSPLENILFSGDTLFNSDIGRTDLPKSSTSAIINSLMTKILPLNADTKVYPGHGITTTIGDEKQMILSLGR